MMEVEDIDIWRRRGMGRRRGRGMGRRGMV